MAHNTSHLPPEIVEIILSKLPVKPLLRFKSVSKSWNTTISDPAFVRNHTRQSKYSNSGNLFLCYDSWIRNPSDTSFMVKLEDRKLKTLRGTECTFKWRDYLCCCEGVMLFATNRRFTKLALWNPSTRTHTNLCHPYCCFGSSFGLCRDPITDDFKVVIVSWDDYSVYSCKNKSWMILKKKIEIDDDTGYGLTADSCYYPTGVCVDGASYWAWSNEGVTQVLYFDPRDNELKMLQKPDNADGEKFKLVDLRGSLGMHCCKGRDETRVRIWMKEKGIDNHSWNELMTVEIVDKHLLPFKPLCFVGNKIVIRVDEIYELVFYSPGEKRFEEFEEDAPVYGRELVPYVGSLFFPH